MIKEVLWWSWISLSIGFGLGIWLLLSMMIGERFDINISLILALPLIIMLVTGSSIGEFVEALFTIVILFLAMSLSLFGLYLGLLLVNYIYEWIMKRKKR